MAFGKCESCATLREMLEHTRGQLADMTEKYHALRVQGANPAEPKIGLPVPQRPAKPADQAIDAVCERFGNNPMLRKRLQRFVNVERQRNTDENEIANAVLHWRSPDDEEAA